jgi:DNA-binding response OmpR family regulator
MPTIILIDHDYASEILAENIRYRGYDCRRINSAAAALRAIDEIARADLVILDIIMARPSSQRSISGERAAVMLTLIHTAKLNEVDPQAWLADVLARIADHKITELAALLPWNWRRAPPLDCAA